MQVINTNVMSLNAQRNLTANSASLAVSIQRLSSGLRINSAKDDAAGLAISERFTTQIRGLNQAMRNSNDGISLAQTTEGALSEISNNLQRIRELAVQARNFTNSASDRAALQSEVAQRLAEIDRTASQTSFNGQKVLDGSFIGASFQVGSNAGETISLSLDVNARLSALGAVATAQSGTLGATPSGGSVAVDNTVLDFSQLTDVAATSGSYTVSPATRLYGTGASAQVDAVATVSIAFGDFSVAGNGGLGFNSQGTLVAANFDFATGTNSGGIAQFDVDGIGITLTADYADETALAAGIQAQLDLNGGAGNYAVTTTGVGNITITRTSGTGAVVISNADANAGTAGFVNSGGTAGVATTNVTFEVDGVDITLDANNASNANVAADLQAALDAAFTAGDYTVTDNGDGTFDITNTGSTTAVDIVTTPAGTQAEQNAVAAGVVDVAGAAGTPAILANAATFEVDAFTVTLDQNYASFDDLANGAGPAINSIQYQLDTAAGAGVYTVTNDSGAITIAKVATGLASTAPVITNATADTDTTAADLLTGTSTAGADLVSATAASFEVDGLTINLTQNFATVGDLVTELQDQLDALFGDDAYTAAAGAGNAFTITNNTAGSDAPTVVAGGTYAAGATAADIGNGDEVGTDGVLGTITLAAGEFTIDTETSSPYDFAGTYADAAALATAINANVSGVFAREITGGKVELLSASSFTLGGTEVNGAMGFAGTQFDVDSGSLSSLNVSTVDAADEAIVRIDAALNLVNGSRADLGAIQNRFESVIANLRTASENLTASRSRIRDADFAAETAELTRNQILQQAGVAMLAQANSAPQNVLSLLR